MNPSHIIRECLTDPGWGMGYPESDIDDTAFTAAADRLFSEQMGMSLEWDRQQSIEEFITEVLRHIDGSLYVDRTTGLFVLSLIRDDYDAGDLLVLGESNIESVQDYTRGGPGEAINSVTVVYWDATKSENGTVTADDTAMVQMYGTNNTTVQFPGFTNADIAARAATRELRGLSQPLLTCKIIANREASSLNVGDPFVFRWPDHHDGDIVMRATQLELGDGKNNRIRITATEDVFAFPDSALIAVEDSEWASPDSEPLAPPAQLAFEAPYYELIQQLGQTTINSQLADDPDIGYLQVAAVRPEDGLNARVWVDSGSGYQEADVLDFCASGLLSASIAELDTTLVLTAAEDLDLPAVDQHLQVDNELMRIDAIDVSMATVTVARGILDTVPKPHLAGTRVYFWDNYASTDGAEYTASDEIDVTVLTNATLGQLALDDGFVSQVAFASRAIRPYPAGKFRLDGLAYPVGKAIIDTVTLSWAHRDRVQQTDGFFYGEGADDIGPETGTTYRIEVDAVHPDDTVTASFYTEDVGLVTSYRYDRAVNDYPADTKQLVFRVFSVRDGYDSWQAPEARVNVLMAPTNVLAQVL